METPTKAESALLCSYETVIEQGFETFVEVGNALAAIRDARLYRYEFVTFEDYCKGRWQLSKSRVYQLISSAEAAQDVAEVVESNNVGRQKINARQAAELASVPREERADVWEEVVTTAPNGKVTAKHVEQVVERRQAEKQGRVLDMPTPHQEAKEDAGRRWSQFLHDIYQQLNSLRDCGGIKRLTSEWPKRTRAEYAKEIRRLRDEMDSCLELLEGA